MLSAMQKRPKRPRDPNVLGKLIVDLSVGEAEDDLPIDDRKDPAAVTLGRKGGEARARSLSKKKRADIARRAAAKRWSKRRA